MAARKKRHEIVIEMRTVYAVSVLAFAIVLIVVAGTYWPRPVFSKRCQADIKNCSCEELEEIANGGYSDSTNAYDIASIKGCLWIQYSRSA
jgi:hypothetical protein